MRLLRGVQEVFGVIPPGWTLPGSLAITTFVIVSAFVIVELLAIVPMFLREFTRHQQRYRWRFRCDLPALVGDGPVTVVDLLEAGLSFTGSQLGLVAGDTAPIAITAPIDGAPVTIRGSATVLAAQRGGDGSPLYRCEATWDTDADRHHLIDLCYVTLAAQDRAYVEGELL
mgnify:CR=1 FL=1